MRAEGRPRRPLRLFVAIAAATLVADQASKAVVLRHLKEGASFPAWGRTLYLTVTHNRGSAFGLLENRDALLLAIGGAVCLGALLLVLFRPDLRGCYLLPLALIWGGSAGNLLDRLQRGAVVDFVDLRVWPVFNLADAAITVGFLILAYQLGRRR